ncbi:hypothetical protein ACIBQ6_03360 [Nonomuraea sp. NPDC049655]|uniref:hypothetical protein n=1 Tax=Nonomuraea sp. NPDC049655 TaxID=3364355 RepID=UPI00379E0E85
MGAQDSNLSSTGFDYVVAVTQDSINGTLEEYLYSGLPETVLCYAYDSSNDPVLVDFMEFVAGAGNTDPFTVPDETAPTDPRVQNLSNAGFAFAIKAKLGVPAGFDPSSLPPIMVLKPGQSYVTYTLMFSEFVATNLTYGPRGPMAWFNQSQPSGTSWTFYGPVDLNFQDTSFTSLPSDVQERLKGIGDPDMFGVQQLYYDLNSSALEQGFQFDELPSNSPLNGFMTADFIDTYWKELGGAEILGYTATQTAPVETSLAVTDVNFFTPDAVGGDGAPLTLNYLCATGNDQLPDTTHAGFGWNWIEPGEVSQYDGVAALNRNTFAGFLLNYNSGNGPTLLEYIEGNCQRPEVTCQCSGQEIKEYYFYFFPDRPTMAFPSSGPQIITATFSQSASDKCGGPLLGGSMKLTLSYDMTVSVQDDTMTIVQHLVLYTYIEDQGTGDGGNVVDKTITDVYTIGVDDMGRMAIPAPDSTTVDDSKTPGVNGFLNWFTGINDLLDYVTQASQALAATTLADVPASVIQNFIFPGGASFSFCDAVFSDNQDLVGHITYADPTL